MSIGAFVRRASHASGKLDAARPYITMFDDITVSTLPTGSSYAYAGYNAGLWPTMTALRARFPNNRLLEIAIFASDKGQMLDIENGDATLEEAPAWYERQVQDGVWRPGLYTAAGNMAALERIMTAAHIERASYRLWTAHYTYKAHLCSPKSCGYGLTEADGTQWTDRALGLSLDQSILLPDFFDPRPAPPKPAPKPGPAPSPSPSWQEAMMNALPTLKQGDVDQKDKPPFVRVMQAAIQAQGHAHNVEAAYDLVPDGNFGPKTVNALLGIQAFFGLHNSSEYQERVCGPQTWPAVISGDK